MEVSVVIPTYNEADNVAPLVDRLEDQLGDREFEIVFVDDDSPDGTADKIEELQEKRDFLRLIRREGKKGIGSAYKAGFKEADGDYVVQMDADLSHRPEDLKALIAALDNGADTAIGSRYVEGGERKDPIHRRIFPIIGSYLYRFGLGSPVKDFTSGFKAFRSEVVDNLDPELPEGFCFQAATLVDIIEKDYEIVEVPIEFQERNSGEPKYDQMDLVKNTWFFSKKFLEKWQEVIKFGVVGASGVFVNMGLLYALTEYFNLFYLVSAAFAVEASIVWNYVWHEVWTFREKGESSLVRFLERLGKFNLVSLVGLALNLVILYILTDYADIHYMVSNLIAIFAVFGWNYFGNVKWTWNGK
jgi:dolichol-phosphate mannosyltransferase